MLRVFILYMIGETYNLKSIPNDFFFWETFHGKSFPLSFFSKRIKT